jgi:hypothetical protein
VSLQCRILCEAFAASCRLTAKWPKRILRKGPYASTQEKRSLDAVMQTGVSNTVGLPRKGLITSCAYVVRFRLVESFRTTRDGEF